MRLKMGFFHTNSIGSAPNLDRDSMFHLLIVWWGEMSWKVGGNQIGQIMSGEMRSPGYSPSTTAGCSRIWFLCWGVRPTLNRYFRKFASCYGVNTRRFSSARIS